MLAVAAEGLSDPGGELALCGRGGRRSGAAGRVLAAVEVKRRSGGLVGGEGAADAALFAISPYQQARVARAAETFAARRSDCRDLELRLDAVTVTIPTAGLWGGLARALRWGWPRHFPAAWQADLR